MSSNNWCRRSDTTSARFVAILHREPLGITLTGGIAGIAIVEQVAKLVDQDVIQVKILDRLLGPDQSPDRAVLFPTAAVHAGFNQLAGLRRSGIRLGQTGFDRVQVDRRAPLHAVAREAELLTGHSAHLNHL